MQSFEITDRKEARCARLAQLQGYKATLTVMGSTVTGLVRSVKEDATSTRRVGSLPLWARRPLRPKLILRAATGSRTHAHNRNHRSKGACRCRYAQRRGMQATLTLAGSTVTGLVHSVMEDRSVDPKRWIIRIIEK
jgi:hypothetical protein